MVSGGVPDVVLRRTLQAVSASGAVTLRGDSRRGAESRQRFLQVDAPDPVAGGQDSTAVACSAETPPALFAGRVSHLLCRPRTALGRCWALAGLGHPVTCPTPGGLAELSSQLALGQRSARLYAGTVGGHRGGVDVAVPVGSSQQPWEPGTWSAWSAAFQPGPLAWPVPAIPDMGSGPSAPPGVWPVSCLIRFPGPASGR